MKNPPSHDGYRKYWTHVQVFAQTLVCGNSKNEIRQRHRGRREVSIRNGAQWERKKEVTTA